MYYFVYSFYHSTTFVTGLKSPTKSCDGLLANFFIRMLGKVDIHSKHSVFSGALLEEETRYISDNIVNVQGQAHSIEPNTKMEQYKLHENYTLTLVALAYLQNHA